MNTLHETERRGADRVLAELEESIQFLAEECTIKRQEENSAAVRDLSSHMIRLKKDIQSLQKERGILVSDSEARQTDLILLDYFWKAAERVVPERVHEIRILQEKMIAEDFPDDEDF